MGYKYDRVSSAQTRVRLALRGDLLGHLGAMGVSPDEGCVKKHIIWNIHGVCIA